MRNVFLLRTCFNLSSESLSRSPWLDPGRIPRDQFSLCTGTRLDHDFPNCERLAEDLSQRTEELPQILRKQLGLIHGRKVPAPGDLRPARDVQAALRKRPRRHGDLLGENGNSYRWRDTVAARETQRPLARFIIETRGRRGRLRNPVEHDVGQELVASKDALDIACTITPRPKFFNDPSCESHWGIIQSVTERLRLSCLFMAVTALGIPPAAELLQICTGNLVVRPHVHGSSEQETPGDVVQMNPNHALGMIESQRNRDDR